MVLAAASVRLDNLALSDVLTVVGLTMIVYSIIRLDRIGR